MPKHLRLLALTALASLSLFFATARASAQTEQALVIVANNLDADYDLLLYDVQHAGSSGHSALIARFEDLEIERADLHDDRTALEPCGCTQLDPLIQAIDAGAGEVAVIIDEWDSSPRPEPQPLVRSARFHAQPQP